MATEQPNISDLDPTAFEATVGDLFKSLGYEVQHVGGRGDGGVDLRLRDERGLEAIAQCKRYTGTVGPAAVRELYGAMQHEGVDRAYLVTTGTFSIEAEKWAREKRLILVDGAELDRVLPAVATAAGDATVETVDRPNAYENILQVIEKIRAEEGAGFILVKGANSRSEMQQLADGIARALGGQGGSLGQHVDAVEEALAAYEDGDPMVGHWGALSPRNFLRWDRVRLLERMLGWLPSRESTDLVAKVGFRIADDVRELRVEVEREIARAKSQRVGLLGSFRGVPWEEKAHLVQVRAKVDNLDPATGQSEPLSAEVLHTLSGEQRVPQTLSRGGCLVIADIGNCSPDFTRQVRLVAEGPFDIPGVGVDDGPLQIRPPVIVVGIELHKPAPEELAATAIWTGPTALAMSAFGVEP